MKWPLLLNELMPFVLNFLWSVGKLMVVEPFRYGLGGHLCVLLLSGVVSGSCIACSDFLEVGWKW